MHRNARHLVQWFALAAFALLSACGFQLQGRQVLPALLANVHVEPVDRQSEFTRALRTSLSASGARLAGEATEQVADVHILRDDFAERVLSVDARNIPTDYELTYTVEIQVRAQQRELLPAEKFELSRIYSFDERKLLAKEREKEILREALARDLASVVTRRLSTLQ
jgi:outer membrane lipopolysaccharide assembly protein LptE/RlpB